MNTETGLMKQEETKALAMAGDVGGEEILASNIVIPKILLMQGLSEMVADGAAQMGEMVRSTTKEKVGGADKPVEIIPLTFNNTWVELEKVGQKFEYRGQVPMTAQNQDLPWEFEKNGTQWKRMKSLNLYALILDDVKAEQAEMEKAKNGEMPDPDKALLPILVSFRSTSFPAGKAITTHFAKARKFGLPGHVSVLKLKCHKEKNDLGTYFVFDVENGGKTPSDVLQTCEYWKGLVASNRVQVDNSDEAADSGAGTVKDGAQF